MDLAGWLRSLGLDRYETAFPENEIDDTGMPSSPLIKLPHPLSHGTGGVGGCQRLRLHSSFHSNKLSETTDRCSLFC
jgi:hypothetical protein